MWFIALVDTGETVGLLCSFIETGSSVLEDMFDDDSELLSSSVAFVASDITTCESPVDVVTEVATTTVTLVSDCRPSVCLTPSTVVVL